MKIHTLDLHFRAEGTIAAYLLQSPGGLALVETGPDSTYPNLVHALRERGFEPSDVRDVLVTHVHLDHAGAAWRFADLGATVHVHPRGVSHLVDPSRLLASAERIYRDRMAELWGTMQPIAPERVRATSDGEDVALGTLRVRALETPGHASHHNAYVVDGLAFTGDVGGVSIGGGPTLPPCPPPDIDVEAWRHSIARLRALAPADIYPTHFGKAPDVAEGLAELEEQLAAWTEWVGARLAEGAPEEALVPRFEAWLEQRLVASGVAPERVAAYRIALPFGMNVPGLVRYWRKFREGGGRP